MIALALATVTLGSPLIDRDQNQPHVAHAAAHLDHREAAGTIRNASAVSDAPTTVATVDALRTALRNNAHHIVITATLDGGPVPITVDVRNPSNSNTIIEGSAPSIELINIQIRVIDGTVTGAVHDITIRNLTIHGRISDLEALTGADTRPHGAGTNYEAISVRGARDVTIDAITAYDTTDDLMSVTKGADRVTISNSNLYYTKAFKDISPSVKWDWGFGFQPLADERLGILVGAQAADSYLKTGLLHVTLSHNHIGSLVRGRPLLRGYVQVLDNTFDNTAADSNQYAAIEVGSGGYVVVGGNVFDHSHNPIVVHLDAASDPYQLYEGDNRFVGTTGVIERGQAMPSGSGANKS
ncbi:pectate lyase [Rathayibacter tanaceti]|uniref:Pectate lyase n=2 Tax=Rathayibacter tanaceti TaxID=1671680 RepID=A0ACD2XIY6_9MICO|nr:Pectate lyase [Rathayibacter tanaceti]TCO36950.1 pectate lyase [Rathayibacter tanaceti]